MASFTLKRFSEPETLKAIDPSILVAFLRQFFEYLQRRGVPLPDSSTEEIDYQKLSRILMTPDELVPPDMVDALYYVHELSDHEGMDTLLDAIEELRLNIQVGPDPTPADVAMLMWLHDPEILKRQHARGYAFRPHRFELFQSHTGGVSASRDKGILVPLQDDLDDWFEKRRRGRGCQVFTFESGDRLWVVVRHGEPYKREGSIRDGKSASEYYRPEKYDVLVYETITGTLGVHAKGVRLISQYVYSIGLFFFGDALFFPHEQEITLSPLLKLGADSLKCEDFPDLEDVKLVEITNVRPGAITEVTIRKSKDIFEGLHKAQRQLPASGEYTSAALKFTVKDRSNEAKVTLRPANVVSYSRNEDRELIEPFLRARGFMPSSRAISHHEPEPVLVDA